jgi:uncharacterized membrane protein
MSPEQNSNGLFARISRVWLVAVILPVIVGCISTPTTLEDAAGTAGAWVKDLGGSVPLVSGTGAGRIDAPTDSAQSDLELTAAERRLRRQSRAFQRTVWEGALIGAGAGALWGTLAGDDAKGILTKTAIGGAVGGLAGAYVASKQREFASAEDQLDSMIADVRQSNRDAEALIVSIREVLVEDRRRLAAAERRYRAGQVTEAELAAIRRSAAANRVIVQDAATGAREQHAMFSKAEQSYRADNPNADTAELNRELSVYRAQIETLDDLAESISVA